MDILTAAGIVAKMMAAKAVLDHRRLLSGRVDDDIDRGIKASGYGKATPRA
jgi:hypothetical protein